MKRSLSFLMLVVITGAACAQWPVELSLPGGMPAHYPIMCADGQDGAVVACAGLAYGYDVWLFRVSSTGQVLWSGNGAPPVRLRLPRSQKPVQLALADSCFVVLIEDWNYAPPSHRQLLVWCVDEQGDSLWCQVVRDSLRGGDVGSLYSLTIINSTDVLACWGDHRLDSAGTWYRSLDLTTGTTRGGGQLSSTTYNAVSSSAPVLIGTGGTVFTVDSTTSEPQPSISGIPFLITGLITWGDTMLVTGQAHDTLLIRAYTDTTLQWQDTVAIPASSGGLRAQMQSLADGVFIVFGNPVGFVGRFLGPSGFGPELVIESQTGYQGGHQWLVSDSAVVAAWANRDLEELWIQHVHFPDGQARWPGGAYVGRVDAWTGPPWLDLCAGGAYGYVMGGWRAVLYIQPADSLVLDAAPFPRATPADEARLFLSPNPCNGPMQIEFELPRPGHATLDLFNVLGQAVMTLTDDWRPAGVHIVSWQPESAGKYFVRLRHDGHTAVASFIYLP